MDMTNWAENEVRIACEREKSASDGADEWDCDCACYGSALKAFNSLCGDGHSGMSISITKNILDRLIDGKCLTPIEDTPDDWSECSHGSKDKKFQCKRMSSLFKKVHSDGSVSYSDVNCCYCFNVLNKNSTYHNGLVERLIEEMFPITMPYMPSSKRIAVACEDFLTDKKNGDYDMQGIYYAIKSDGERVDINRFFDLRNEEPKEISKSEYDALKARAEQ